MVTLRERLLCLAVTQNQGSVKTIGILLIQYLVRAWAKHIREKRATPVSTTSGFVGVICQIVPVLGAACRGIFVGIA
jgi:hypothetical protein